MNASERKQLIAELTKEIKNYSFSAKMEANGVLCVSVLTKNNYSETAYQQIYAHVKKCKVSVFKINIAKLVKGVEGRHVELVEAKEILSAKNDFRFISGEFTRTLKFKMRRLKE